MPQSSLVSIVVPVFNGARYLEECLDSALAQQGVALELVVLDNASTDDTPAIAAAFARRDSRVRIFRNDATLPPIDNWNRAMGLMSAQATWCRVLHADDALYEGSLARMVALGDSDPRIGIVGSLRRRGQHVECEGLPRERTVFDGAEVARLFLRGEVFALAPTSGLLRAELVRARQPFYPPHLLHADLAAWLDILDGVQFGFVHDILSFSRVHEDSITATVAERRRTLMREYLVLLRDYGPRYLPAGELAALERRHVARCHRMLLRERLGGGSRDVIDYHLEGLRAAGCAPGLADYVRAGAAELGMLLRDPAKLITYWHRLRLP